MLCRIAGRLDRFPLKRIPCVKGSPLAKPNRGGNGYSLPFFLFLTGLWRKGQFIRGIMRILNGYGQHQTSWSEMRFVPYGVAYEQNSARHLREGRSVSCTHTRSDHWSREINSLGLLFSIPYVDSSAIHSGSVTAGARDFGTDSRM